MQAGYIRREEAWELLGCSINTWQRWEREGEIACGHQVPSAPKLHNLEDIHRLLDEYGRMEPPYPDPIGRESTSCRSVAAIGRGRSVAV